MRASSRMISRQACWPKRLWVRSLSVAASAIALTTNGSFSWGAFSRKLHPRGRNANLILGGLREQRERNYERKNTRENPKERCRMEKATDSESVFRHQAAGNGTSVYWGI